MKTILVTGASGFIGRNLCARLEQDNYNIIRFTRDDSLDELNEGIKKADFVFHLAAVMRPENDSEFNDVNVGLTNSILTSIADAGRPIPILMTSSIQAELDNSYGVSKKTAESLVLEWAKEGNRKAYIYRLPNVFGKWSRPNYSSVVATFCYNISHNQDISIHDPKKELDLAYIDDVIDEFIKSVEGIQQTTVDGYYYIIPRTFKVSLQELADKIYEIHNNQDTAPNPDSTFEKFLSVTYTYFKDI